MNYHLLLQVVEELSLLITGAKLERVLQGADRNIYLLFRKNRKNYTLLLSTQRAQPRMHLVGRKPESAAEVHPLVLQLRSRLAGARLVNIALLNHDRVVALRFLKEADEFSLVFELTGSSANLFFCNSAMSLTALYHPVAASEHTRRILLPGCSYEPPDKKDEVPPVPEASAASPSPNEYAERYYEMLHCEQQLVSLRSALRTAVRRAVARAERKRDALASDLRALQNGDVFRMKGDLLLANLGNLKTETGMVELAGPDGALLSVALDPRLTPAKNAESYFKKYKKAKAGLPLVLSRVQRTDGELSGLETRLSEIENARDLNELLPIKATLIDQGYVKAARDGRGKKVAAPLSGVRKILLQGWEIFVGRNAAGNDLITTKLARPDDLWLHAEGLPGSHVLVRNAGRKEIPTAIFLAAASLAALYSKGRGAGKVPVAYCEARYVRKPKGAKPGLVTLSRRKTVLVEPADVSAK